MQQEQGRGPHEAEKGKGGTMGRVASIPERMTVAEAERIFVADGGRLYRAETTSIDARRSYATIS